MSRQKSVEKADKHDDLSIVQQAMRDFESLLSPPEIEIPPRDYVQRSDGSNLPDGSTFDEKLQSPLGETISQFSYRISKQAREMWDIWTKPGSTAFPTANGEVIIPLSQSIEELLLTESEKIQYTRYKRLMLLEEADHRKKEEARALRKVSESTNLHFDDHKDLVVPDSSRFLIKKKQSKDEFGNTTVVTETIDRCNGNPNVKVIPGISIPDTKRVIGAPSHEERLAHINMTSYQTEVWRQGHRKDEDNRYYRHIVSGWDSDYIGPLDNNKKNFSVYPPSSRPYNCVFRVYTSENRYYKVYPALKKDYTSLSSLVYMLRQQKKQFLKVELDEVYRKSSKTHYPNCKFEVDLRVTYSDDMVPNANSYKKVDPESKLGKWLLQRLNEQPHLFEEFHWSYEDVDSDGTPKTEHKIAVGYKITHPTDKYGKRVYWLYLDDNKISKAKVKIPKSPQERRWKGKMVPPKIIYKPLISHPGYADVPAYVRKELPFTASVRVSEGFSFVERIESTSPNKEKKIERVYIPFEVVKERIFNILYKKGYKFVKQEQESPFNNILLFHFIHSSAETKEQRKLLYAKLKETDHD